MTSKEALLKIESFCAYDDEVKEALSVLAKDLEVLEILMKYIYEGGYGFYFKNNFLLGTEDYNKIKEWLHNESNQ